MLNKWSLFSSMTVIKTLYRRYKKRRYNGMLQRYHKNRMQRYMGPGGLLNLQKLFDYLLSAFLIFELLSFEVAFRLKLKTATIA